LHIFGPGHVQSTEYGPGQYTRWFLAWTFDQPLATASSAACPTHEKDKFQVSIQSLIEQGNAGNQRVESIVDAMTEVVDRVVAFCDSSPGGWDLTATTIEHSNNRFTARIQESMPLAVHNFVDEALDCCDIPEPLLQALQSRVDNSLFLPEEGHFLIEVQIETAIDNMNINVHLFNFRHSARGAKGVEKIRSGLEGEVCRTNRKWRKIHQRLLQQHQQL
jgi:hypothetical protein